MQLITYYPLPVLDLTSYEISKGCIYFFNNCPENISLFRSIEVDYIDNYLSADIAGITIKITA